MAVLRLAHFHQPDCIVRKPVFKTTKGIADFLRDDAKVGALLPAAARLVELQRDCAALLPQLFTNCTVSQAEAGNLTIAVPNSAVAAKLKQQLPKLQESLQKQGWQVSAIRIKVQARNIIDRPASEKQLVMPRRALSALSELQHALDDEPRNQGLKDALSNLLRRHRPQN